MMMQEIVGECLKDKKIKSINIFRSMIASVGGRDMAILRFAVWGAEDK